MLGSKVQTTYKENIAVGAQLNQTVASLVNQGYKMIFGTSYGFFDKKLAAKYPSVLFEQATGTDTAKNLSEYFGAAEDTVYLSGMAAGAATKYSDRFFAVSVPVACSNSTFGYFAASFLSKKPYDVPKIIL